MLIVIFMTIYQYRLLFFKTLFKGKHFAVWRVRGG